jgi:CspA family cold shock protein
VDIRIKKVNFKQNNMNTGVVKFFNDAKGFGFIKDNGTGKEYFVHVSGVIDQIKEGDAVTFEVGEGKKGPIAVDVKIAR